MQVQGLKEFVKINSIVQMGNEEVVNLLIPIFEQLGAKLVLQQVPHSTGDLSKRQFNLIGIFGDDLVDGRTRKGLLLCAPVDTVDPGNPKNWTKCNGNPFDIHESESRLYGLGVANTKANFWAILQAVASFKDKKFTSPLYVVANCGGENYFSGAKYLIQSGALNPKHVIVGRPTGLRLTHTEIAMTKIAIRMSFVSVEKDANDYNAKIIVTAKEHSFHTASRKNERSAISQIFKFFESIRASTIEHKIFLFSAPGEAFRMGDEASLGLLIKPKDIDIIRDRFKSFCGNNKDLNLEMRMGGIGERGVKVISSPVVEGIVKIANQVQEFHDKNISNIGGCVQLTSIEQGNDYVEIMVDLYMPADRSETEDKKMIEDKLKESIMNIRSELTNVSMDWKKKINTYRYFTDPASDFVQSCRSVMKKSGIVPEVGVGSTVTEASLFGEKKFPVVSIGIGSLEEGINCPNESIGIAEYNKLETFYREIIERNCFT
ncbi:MAG: M20/M25/M40 family metallo-hydrolase [Oligoflexia bacterium]|nr:M20/M25/M40 family metallo-hydrolase [Oligoflexia bacterium]